ncbi:MAG: response regulator transcription factor [Bacteroidetes bacterium]|nr:response regulator transcription factor [Bacteroidota bacterium]
MLIQIIEDEVAIADVLSLNLQIENFEVIISTNGITALQDFEKFQNKIGLVICDIMLPELNGYDVIKGVKKINPHIPFIFLTAKNNQPDKIEGLKLGADDYISKPFDLEEFLLRIKNVIKRYYKEEVQTFSFKNCVINFETFEVITANNQKITISKREIGLLKLLINNEGKVISRDEIIEQLWDLNENASARTIDNYILNFRKMFEQNPKTPMHFLSIRGVGYKFLK